MSHNSDERVRVASTFSINKKKTNDTARYIVRPKKHTHRACLAHSPHHSITSNNIMHGCFCLLATTQTRSNITKLTFAITIRSLTFYTHIYIYIYMQSVTSDHSPKTHHAAASTKKQNKPRSITLDRRTTANRQLIVGKNSIIQFSFVSCRSRFCRHTVVAAFVRRPRLCSTRLA